MCVLVISSGDHEQVMKNNILAFLLTYAFTFSAQADQVIDAYKINNEPVIDGHVETIWNSIPELVTKDPVANIDISIRAMYSGDRLFFLVRFPDGSENRAHKTLVWDPALEIYQVGPQREDVFVFKWNKGLISRDLSLSSDTPYTVDIWYWKSHRTDHAGYADDKYQTYSHIKLPNSQSLVSKDGEIFYLVRKGDEGQAAYKSRLQSNYEKETMPAFDLVQPEGSRADVHAKGRWNDGFWTVEFARQLSTGNTDDVNFDLKQQFQFGVSRYEIAGRKPNPDLEQPYYGSGDIGESLLLRFKK